MAKGIRKTTEQFKNEVFNLESENYIVLGEYINNRTKIKIKHVKCDCEYEVTPNNFLRGDRCPRCANNIKKTLDEFKREVFNLTGNEYSVMGNYINAHTKLKIIHNECGHIFEIAPNTFLNGGNRCPKCKFSKAEKVISNWLSDKNISFGSQYRFDDCRFKKPLPFDFVLFDDEEIKCLIEYDGEQHFISKVAFGGKEGFKLNQKRDQIKNQYCKDNNIPLYRIPYWKFNEIESIINKLIHNEYVEVNETSFLVQ